MFKIKKLNQIEDNNLDLNSQQKQETALTHQKKIHKATKNKKRHATFKNDQHIHQKIPSLKLKRKPEIDNSNSTTNFQSSKSEVDSNLDFQFRKCTELQEHFKYPNYISWNNSNTIMGQFGHSTLFFKKPIIEGNYYFGIKILNSDASKFSIKNPSSIRIGLCNSNHNLNVPLGVGNSLAFSSAKGAVFCNSQKKIVGEICKQGDIIGCCAEIMPPHKHRRESQKNQQNKVIFYKNGHPICKSFCQLKNNFYHFAISLYNFARVQILFCENQMSFKPENFESISNLKPQTLYKNLKFIERE